MFVFNLVLNILVDEICYELYCWEAVEESYRNSEPVYNPDWMFEKDC